MSRPSRPSRTTTLRETIEETLSATDLMIPQEIADKVLGEVHDYEEALREALPEYVRFVMAQARIRRVPEELAVLTAQDTEYNFAPDDLLTESEQKTQKKLLKARGSAKVNAIRNEWQSHFKDRVFNGKVYVLFGDMTPQDLYGAANFLRDKAATFSNKAAYYERIATAVPEGGKVGDLTDYPTA